MAYLFPMLSISCGLLPLWSLKVCVVCDSGAPEQCVPFHWLDVTPEMTWEVFYGKLRQPGLDMHRLAVEIARKHCPHVLQ